MRRVLRADQEQAIRSRLGRMTKRQIERETGISRKGINRVERDVALSLGQTPPSEAPRERLPPPLLPCHPYRCDVCGTMANTRPCGTCRAMADERVIPKPIHSLPAPVHVGERQLITGEW